MSRGAERSRAEMLRALAHEFRQSTGLGASLWRAVASRMGMAVTDVQVLDLLESSGPMTAGQIADHTGLTTGSTTSLLNRLEETGLVRRERDPADGRRVIVQLTSGADPLQAIAPTFDALSKALENLTAPYDDEHLAFLLEVLAGSNASARQELVGLLSSPEREGDSASAPLGEVTEGRLVLDAPAAIVQSARLVVRAGDSMIDLYQAHFEGPAPDVKVTAGEVAVRYPRRLRNLIGGQRAAEVTLNTTIPWHILVQGGGANVTAELEGLDLRELEVKGGGSVIRLNLPVPAGVVPIRISGGGSEVTVRRPAGVAARVHLKGLGSMVVFDDHKYTDNAMLHSAGFTTTGPHYSFDISSAGSLITITFT
jgi:DNA-binding MarR family transcriptional regulator